MKDLLRRLNINGLDTTNYIDTHANDISNIPNIGIAASGGGWRALLNGAGALAAFDSRTDNATAAGHLGGLLQSATYLAGLSGGSWLVGSMYMNNFSTIPSMLGTVAEDSASGFLWGFQESIAVGPPRDSRITNVVDTADYYATIYNQVSDKEAAGYNTTLTDYWGRALAYQLINATDGGPAYTWSSLAQQSFFSNGEAPLPLVVADGRYPGEIIISLNATNYEFSPWEMGSWDPTLYGFVPMEYVGSAFENGELPSNSSCIRGFDSASYIMGTSSSLFNQFILNLPQQEGVSGLLTGAIDRILTRIGRAEEDIADWTPNPFYGWNLASNSHSDDRTLTLVDGGEDLQNIPLTPLIQPVRAVDVIFAVDSSADTLEPGANWPNGTALVASYERSLEAIANGTSFPSIPAQNSFVNLGLNNRPTFFGCDSSNTTSATPLIVYLPNSPYTYQSNVSTFQPSYPKDQQYAIVQNGYNVVTQGNGTRDAQWPTCVGCAILQRSLQRTNTAIPQACQECFSRYCWDGRVDNAQPATPYQPAYVLEDQAINATKSAATVNLAPGQVAMGVAALFSYLLM
jgi:lysophospholipase